MDIYRNFSALMETESDFHIECFDRGSAITILAPHGGNIEPHTSEITRLIAGDKYNFFCFNGLKPENNHHLHITSHRYDEEHALHLVQTSTTVVAVHGCSQREPIVYVGGLDTSLMKKIRSALELWKIPTAQPKPHFTGTSKHNICNRGLTGKGVQLEISRAFRDSRDAWSAISRAIRPILFVQKTEIF
jgi:phage replication-related protein YjqB (UPF0714/DUF867 family)